MTDETTNKLLADILNRLDKMDEWMDAVDNTLQSAGDVDEKIFALAVEMAQKITELDIRTKIVELNTGTTN